MRPGERSDNLGFVHRLPGGTVRAGSRGSARVSELGMGSGFGGHSGETNTDALQQSVLGDRGVNAQPRADMGMGGGGGGEGYGSGRGGGPPSRGGGGSRNGRGGRGGGSGRGGQQQGQARSRGAGQMQGPGMGMGTGMGMGQSQSQSQSQNQGQGQPGYPLPPQAPAAYQMQQPSSVHYAELDTYDDADDTSGYVTMAPPPSMTAMPAAPQRPSDDSVGKLKAELAGTGRRLAGLEATVAQQAKSILAASATAAPGGSNAEEFKQFFGLVAGGAANAVLLFPDIAEVAGGKAVAPCAKASRAKWVKLSYPRVRREGSEAEGSSRPSWWYRVHIVDGTTGEYKLLWVCDRADDGTAAFERFVTYPQ